MPAMLDTLCYLVATMLFLIGGVSFMGVGSEKSVDPRVAGMLALIGMALFLVGSVLVRIAP